MTGYDVAALRARFPALDRGYAHFDGPGGSQVPLEVAQAVAGTLTAPLANRGRTTPAERFSDEIVLAARDAMADATLHPVVAVETADGGCRACTGTAPGGVGFQLRERR